jgi:hypothetical protein
MKRRAYDTHFKSSLMKSGDRRIVVTIRKDLNWYKSVDLLHNNPVPDVSSYALKKGYLGL